MRIMVATDDWPSASRAVGFVAGRRWRAGTVVRLATVDVSAAPE